MSPEVAPASFESWRIVRWRSRHQAYREILAPDVTLTLLRIPAGSFLMGAPEGEEGSTARERPVHRVAVGEFLMGQTPITQAQWQVVASWEPVELPLPSSPSRFSGANRPVENVSWFEAVEFCRRLEHRTGKRFCLPSEAQWEYACRAGTTTPFHFGATLSTEVASYNGIYRYGEGLEEKTKWETTEVARFPANAWGLQDMHGNVWEWCLDHWHNNYKEAPSDGSAWLDSAGSESEVSEMKTEANNPRLLRGGSWDGHPLGCRSAYRYRLRPDFRGRFVGFRLCCLPQD